MRGQIAAIDRLLPREADRAQVRIAQLEHARRRHLAQAFDQPSGDCPRRGGRDLLRDDDMHQRLEARRPVPGRRRADIRDGFGHIGIGLCQMVERLLQLRLVFAIPAAP